MYHKEIKATKKREPGT